MMARCNPMENMHEKIREPDSPEIVQEEEPVFIRPVLSVRCLYEDLYEPSASKCSNGESSSKYINFDAVPELHLNSPTKVTHQELSSSKSSYVGSPLNSKAVPELSLNSRVKVTPQEQLLRNLSIETSKYRNQYLELQKNVSGTEKRIRDYENLSKQFESQLVKEIEPRKNLEDSIHKPEVSNKAEEHPNLQSQNTGTSVICIPVTIKQPRPVISLRSSFKGICNFMIKVDCNSIARKKSDSPVYSESRKKLYVCKDNPFRILVSAENVPSGSFIRFQAVYSKLESSSCPVIRCPTHAQSDFIKGCSTFEHVVQCVSDAAVYEKDTKTGRFSVSVPYEKPQDDTRFSTYLVKLTCFSSCCGGINRRPFILVFTLENGKIPLGRQTIETRVCSCPARDLKTDNEKEEKEKNNLDKLEENSISENDEEMSEHKDEKLKPEENTRHHEPSQSSSSNGAEYSLTVKDRELYDFLMHMKVLYEAGGYNLSPDI